MRQDAFSPDDPKHDNPDEGLQPMGFEPEVSGLSDGIMQNSLQSPTTPKAAARVRHVAAGATAVRSSPSPLFPDPGAADAFKLHSRKGAKRVIFLQSQGCITEVGCQ
jgi:hypothetical protein